MTTSSTTNIRALFHLHSTPFTRELKISARYNHPEHDEIVTSLVHTVEARMSGALIGSAGTGKSVILRALMDTLPGARYRVHYVHVSSLSKRDFCRHLAIAIGAKPAGHVGSLIGAIQDRATTLVSQDALRPVIIIDESHEMRPDVLGLLRLLTNFEVDSKLVLSFILAGQAPLRTLLRRDELAAIRGRLAYVASLRTLTRDESQAYLKYRAGLAGAATSLFDENALEAIYEVAQGNLRALNTVALNTLHEAAADGATVCGTEHVIRARQRTML